MNSSLIFVLLIVAMCLAASTIQTWLKQKKQAPAEPDDELQDTLQKIEGLEERIRVLERIITENRFDLKSEIDAL